MAEERVNELQKLKGVGEVLSRRLVEAGLDTFARVAAAGEEALRKIPGINPKMVPSILAQAGELASESGKSRSAKVAELKQHAAALKETIQAIALNVRERFEAEVAGKLGKKVEKDLLKAISSLEKVEAALETRVKKAGKGLVKAEQRLAGLCEAELKGVGKGLKKARKALKRVIS
jgi:excinuclease UvrABC nuclease subunit